MAASKSVSWSTNKAGYDPGQKQSITVSFKKRSHKTVTCHVSFSATSLGRDDYTASQRHNHASVIIQRKTDSGDWSTVATHSWNYQLHGGSGTSTSHSDDFSFDGPYGVTSFRVLYDNDRVGTNTPYYGPKSTGKVENANVGTLKVDDCDKVTIKYHSGLNKDAIGPDDHTTLSAYDLPDSKEIYWGKDFTISSKKPKDNFENYVFTGWDVGDSWKVNSKTKKKRKVNTTDPKYGSGDKYKDAKGNVHLYACWTPMLYKYRFYPTQKDAEDKTNEWTELVQKRYYGDDPLKTPDIRTDNSNSKYYKKGYHCVGWQHWINLKSYKEDTRKIPRIVTHLFEGDGDKECNVAQNCYSWPLYESNEGGIIFDYGYDNRIDTLSPYISDKKIELIRYCTIENGGTSVDPRAIRPGFRLLGWSKSVPKKEYYLISDKDIPDYIKYDDTYSATIKSGSNIKLYAIWRIESTLYVYTNKSSISNIDKSWKLVTPYIFDNGSWKQSVSMVCVSGTGPEKKKYNIIKNGLIETNKEIICDDFDILPEGANIWVNVYCDSREERLQPDFEPFRAGIESNTFYESLHDSMQIFYDGYKTLRLQPLYPNEYWTVELTYTIQSENLTWKL